MKKLRNTLYIQQDHAYVHKSGETIVVEKKVEGTTQKLGQMPIHTIGQICCFGNIIISPQLMDFCMESGTGLALFSEHGRYRGRVVGQEKGNVLLRRAQYRIIDAQASTLAKHTIAAKVKAARGVLTRHQRNHGSSATLQKTTNRLKQIVESLSIQTDLDKIRGYEGEAASQYFAVFDTLITDNATGMVFNKRTRRPPKDPVNALLSFAYSLWATEITSALTAIGLDPQVGFLHAERPGRSSLSLDILEEFRAPIVDRFVLNLINRRQIKLEDFVTDAVGGVRLKEASRKKFFAALKKKRAEEITHPFLKEKVPIGLLPHTQAMLLSWFIRGEIAHYPPFCLAGTEA